MPGPLTENRRSGYVDPQPDQLLIFLVQLIVIPAVMKFIPHPLAIGPDFQANVLLTGVLVVLPVVVAVSLAVHLVIERPFFSFKRAYVLPAKPRLHEVAPAVRLRNIAGD
jgi:peptidoglycan/LPS O-acetylase OafA/YrhL